MLKYLKVQKKTLLIIALASVALGLMLVIFCKKDLTQFMMYCVAAFAAVLGIVRLARYFLGRSRSEEVGGAAPDLLMGIVYCAAGVIIALSANALASFLAVILGLYVLLDGAASLRNALSLRSMSFGNWRRVLTLSIITLALGVGMIVSQSFFGGSESPKVIMLLNILLGAGLIFNGAVNLWVVRCLSKADSDASPDIIDIN